MVSMSIERELFFTYAAVKNLNYNFSAIKDLTVSSTRIFVLMSACFFGGMIITKPTNLK